MTIRIPMYIYIYICVFDNVVYLTKYVKLCVYISIYIYKYIYISVDPNMIVAILDHCYIHHLPVDFTRTRRCSVSIGSVHLRALS